VPERHTDFIFPIFAAAYGFVGVTVLFLLYLLFLGTLLGQALRTRDPSGRLLAVGVFTLFAGQLVVNTAMTVGLLPVVGVPLPFFSYGGSSLLVSFAALGLALSVGVDPVLDFGKDPFGD
jgi:cell division protein FtsW (lipid II flippase)